MNILQSILKCVQIRNHPSRKPRIFPIASLEEMDNFENIDENAYSDVVRKKFKITIQQTSIKNYILLLGVC